jgi:hypothetical protein
MERGGWVRVASIPTPCRLRYVTGYRQVIDGRGGEGRIGIGVVFVDDRVLIREGWGCQEQDGRLEYRNDKSED